MRAMTDGPQGRVAIDVYVQSVYHGEFTAFVYPRLWWQPLHIHRVSCSDPDDDVAYGQFLTDMEMIFRSKCGRWLPTDRMPTFDRAALMRLRLESRTAPVAV